MVSRWRFGGMPFAPLGVDHVGLGSDFDGATPAYGLEDVSQLPRITSALRERGYSDTDVRKLLGGNVLRVMELAKAVAVEFGKAPRRSK